MAKSRNSKDINRFLIAEEEIDDYEETWRHTYNQEQSLMDAVRKGHTDNAIELSHLIDNDSGRLSTNELEHWKKVAIIGISLCSRAAIEGGLPPKDAFRISGYYIRRTDHCSDSESMLTLRDDAIRDLTNLVSDGIKSRQYSIYTRQCMDYIEKHYREKIYLDEIAELLGISPSYLSRLFKSETGENIQDYLVRIRVDRAANLLRFSDESLSRIAQYVNFPSQSYFGQAFKKLRGITPAAFRKQYQSIDWTP